MKHDVLSTQIRIARYEDAALLAEIGRRAFDEAYGHFNDSTDMAVYLAEAFSPEKQAAELLQPSSMFLILETEGQPAGYARLLDIPAPAFVKAARPLELVRIYVLRPWMNQGLGGQLMQCCINQAQAGGYDALWLSVWTKNPRAVAFYRKWGFEVSGRAPFIIGSDVQEDYIMTRAIAPAATGG